MPARGRLLPGHTVLFRLAGVMVVWQLTARPWQLSSTAGSSAWCGRREGLQRRAQLTLPPRAGAADTRRRVAALGVAGAAVDARRRLRRAVAVAAPGAQVPRLPPAPACPTRAMGPPRVF